MNNRNTLKVKVKNKWLEADNIYAYELVREDGETLPPFTAGAHIDVLLSDRLCRQYSLCNNPVETERYVIAVLKEPNSRGGSLAMHDDIHIGQVVTISEPRNLFSLSSDVTESQKKAVLVAGGIGVTPLLSMAKFLNNLNINFDFYYYGRSRSKMAFIDEVIGLGSDNIRLSCDDEDSLSLSNLLSSYAGDNEIIYTCGPSGFLDVLRNEARSKGWKDEQVCFERFTAPEQSTDDASNDFYVKLLKSDCQLYVPEDKSILDVMFENGIDVETSCQQGICGSCMVDVIEGEPDHRDYYLSDEEKNHNNKIMICCSRSKSKVLVLDI